MKSFIVKIQRPLITINDVPPYLIYNEDQSVMLFIDVDSVEGEHITKMYFSHTDPPPEKVYARTYLAANGKLNLREPLFEDPAW